MIRFYIPNRKPEEEIILLVRRHPFILFVHTHLWFVLMLLPVVLYLIFQDQVAELLFNTILYPLVVAGLGIFYSLAWLLVLNRFVDYYLDVWIVTNFRILNIEQKQIFSRVTAEHELDKIQDVASEVHGILPTFLDYGEVHIQTAAEEQRFVFEQVPHPQAIKEKIAVLCERVKKNEASSPIQPTNPNKI